ncbi:MAG TPA: AarF/UbiB family protein [Pirellulaceae bacterium]|nr:AarF/UbiB family protein [Pirellulaceae bacterium]HMO92785.1 AarF/UbiB family protein [Pirellulaceae bacterium]HMP69367.1 AarF/UbiB family protein [Pirellulaceae bacterium]
MKRPLPSIPHLYRNVKRWTEIVSILSKYGLADWLSHININIIRNSLKNSDGEILARLTQPQRIRLALTELGPTFIKLGQLMSTRPDIVGVELANELTQLQADVPADSFEEIKATIETELNRSLDQLFATFEETPIASASIGQVHRATLPGGERVVVKVRHSRIERTVETDLDILAGLALIAEKLPDLKPYQPRSLIAEMSRTMQRELDFQRELRNLMQFQTILKSDTKVVIPDPISSHSSSGVLTMTELCGTKLARCDVLDETERDKIARLGARIYLKMIFEHGFYHADPHPGNLVLMSDNRLGLLDFGMVGRISEHMREDIESMLVSMVGRDVGMLVALVKRVGSCPIDLDQQRLSIDIEDFVGQYATLVLSEFDMSSALGDFVALVRRYNISLPAEVALLIKVLVTLEGTGRLLNPSFSLMEVMQPFHRRLIIRRMSPRRQLKKMYRLYYQVERLAESLPGTMTNILDQVQSGKFDIHLVHRKLGPTVNRLVLGLMSSAMFLGSSWMLSSKVPPVLFPGEGWFGIRDLSIFGLVGMLVSLVMGLRLIWAIRSSGNLEQPD